MITMLMLAGVVSATAIPVPEVPNIDYFCAAPLGAYSQVRIHRGGISYRISGRLQPVQLEPVLDTSKPIPFDGVNIPSTYRAASVEIMDDETNAQVGIHLVPHNRQPDDSAIISDLVVTTWIDGDQRRYNMGMNSSTDYTDAVPFEIVTDGEIVEIQMGGKRLRLDVPLSPKTVVELVCIGGDFGIEDIRITARSELP